jgi:SAM-dependent methyltransferase
MTGERPDDLIWQRYDSLLALHGDTAQGAHWPNEADRRIRHEVMLGLIPDPAAPAVLCDLGCGTGALLDHIRAQGLNRLDYIGADRSAAALDFARQKHPGSCFIEIDVNNPDVPVNRLACDWLVCNGVFTVKWDLTEDQMWSFLSATLHRVWPVVRRGLAFNVMSKAVDWERADLFHASMDQMAVLLHRMAGRRVVFRADYGLYEYTAYVYR